MELFIKDSLTKFLFYLPVGKAVGTFIGYNCNIITMGKAAFMHTIKLPDEPFDLVSFYCIPNLLAYSYPQSGNIKPVLLKDDGKMPSAISLS